MEAGTDLTYSNPPARVSRGAFRWRIGPILASLLAVAPVAAGPAGATDLTNPYREIAVADGGRITGRVMAGGASPKVERYIVAKQTDVCGGNYRDAPLVLVNAGALQDVVVYLDHVPAGKLFRAAAKKITINQRGCTFEPFLSVLMNSGELEAFNSDPLFHNIHVYELRGRSRNTIANVSQPRKGDIMTMSVHLEEGRALKIECAAHDFMHAYVFVASNPYYAEVATDGSFEITNVPPGQYTIRAWHPYLGEREQSIEVLPGAGVSVNFEY